MATRFDLGDIAEPLEGLGKAVEALDPDDKKWLKDMVEEVNRKHGKSNS